MLHISLREHEVVIGGLSVDPRSKGASALLRDLLGPEIEASEAGVRGVGRIAHWLASGAVLVSEGRTGELVSLFFCFDRWDSSPFPDSHAEVHVFDGLIECAGHRFCGLQAEHEIRAMRDVHGAAGMLSIDIGDLTVGLDLRRVCGPGGKRLGPRRLVQIVAEWGPIMPFAGPL